NLSYNNLTRLDEGSLAVLGDLHTLRLGHNSISHINEGAFRGLKALRVLKECLVGREEQQRGSSGQVQMGEGCGVGEWVTCNFQSRGWKRFSEDTPLPQSFFLLSDSASLIVPLSPCFAPFSSPLLPIPLSLHQSTPCMFWDGRTLFGNKIKSVAKKAFAGLETLEHL
ncbi:hypothetical protein XENOCAPTIV_006768, partial [Xenoophorus captivus]